MIWQLRNNTTIMHISLVDLRHSISTSLWYQYQLPFCTGCCFIAAFNLSHLISFSIWSLYNISCFCTVQEAFVPGILLIAIPARNCKKIAVYGIVLIFLCQVLSYCNLLILRIHFFCYCTNWNGGIYNSSFFSFSPPILDTFLVVYSSWDWFFCLGDW